LFFEPATKVGPRPTLRRRSPAPRLQPVPGTGMRPMRGSQLGRIWPVHRPANPSRRIASDGCPPISGEQKPPSAGSPSNPNHFFSPTPPTHDRADAPAAAGAGEGGGAAAATSPARDAHPRVSALLSRWPWAAPLSTSCGQDPKRDLRDSGRRPVFFRAPTSGGGQGR